MVYIGGEPALLAAALLQKSLSALAALLLQLLPQGLVTIAHSVQMCAAIAVAVRIKRDIGQRCRLLQTNPARKPILDEKTATSGG